MSPIIRLGQPFVGTYNHQNFCKGLAIVSPGNMLRCYHNLSRLFRIHVFQIKKATKTLPAASRLVDGTKRPFLHVKTDIDSIFESPSGPLHIFRFDIEIIYLKYAPNPKKKRQPFCCRFGKIHTLPWRWLKSRSLHPSGPRCHQLGVFPPFR